MMSVSIEFIDKTEFLQKHRGKQINSTVFSIFSLKRNRLYNNNNRIILKCYEEMQIKCNWHGL